ncbi:MAG: hypothetical protein LBQ64_04555 [Bacteroidales bacterium]|nr:hypothetical protein [Bacteroidales bacterium]
MEKGEKGKAKIPSLVPNGTGKWWFVIVCFYRAIHPYGMSANVETQCIASLR